MAPDDDLSDLLTGLYEEQGAKLHRLAVLLGAEDQAARIVRSALLALHRRGKRVVDPVERIQFLQEHVVHLTRAVRPATNHLILPQVEEPRQVELLRAVSAFPPRVSELLVVSHYLGVFGPDLAGIMRLSVRGCNRKLEVALEALRNRVGDPTPGSLPGVIESLSQELSAALRSGARSIQVPETEVLQGELLQLVEQRGRSVGLGWVAVLTVIAIAAGLVLASVTRPEDVATEVPTVTPSAQPTIVESRSLPAQVRNTPLYYVGRQDGKLYRELRDLPASGNLVGSALLAILTLAPLDPDYESVWGPGQLLSAELSGDRLIVDLTAEAYRDITSPVLATRAINQVVYTAAELVGNPDLRVLFRADSGPPPEPFISDQGFQRTGLEPMPAVWISSPKNAAQVTPGQIVIVGTVKPEIGEPIIRVTDIDTEAILLETSAQTSTGVNVDGWRVWTVTATLPAGNYDIRAGLTQDTTFVSENKSVRVGQ